MMFDPSLLLGLRRFMDDMTMELSHMKMAMRATTDQVERIADLLEKRFDEGPDDDLEED